MDNADSIEKICDGSIGTIYKLKNTTQPMVIKCIKNVRLLNELVY